MTFITSAGGQTEVVRYREFDLAVPQHHTLVHEGEWQIKVLSDGGFVFLNPAGDVVTDPTARAARPLVHNLVGVTQAKP